MDSVRWEPYKLMLTYREWLAHILLCQCWDKNESELGTGGVLLSFVEYSFDPECDVPW